MGTVMNPSEVAPPSEAEIQDAAKAAQALKPLLKKSKRRVPSVLLRPEGPGAQDAVAVPQRALRLLVEILKQMAQGNSVTLVPLHAELTTQEAATLLHVSRPYLIGLLEQGRIAFHKTGTHRRIRLEDLLAFQRAEQRRQEASLHDLAAEAQTLGLGR
jgi:excisionase family DNA binding protein